MAGKRKTDSDGNVIGGSSRPAKPRKQGTERQFAGWVNIELSAGEREAFFAWAEKHTLDDLLQRAVENGYRASQYYDEYNECCAASLTCWADGDPTYGYALSMRSDNAIMALWRVLYAHFEVTHGNWFTRADKPRKSDW